MGFFCWGGAGGGGSVIFIANIYIKYYLLVLKLVEITIKENNFSGIIKNSFSDF
jgi:hypothetical protein